MLNKHIWYGDHSCTGNEPALTEEQKIVPPEKERAATEDAS